METKLKEGDAAPDFTAATDKSGDVTLSCYLGKSVVLFFYPKDNTPGCTTEACGFRDNYEEITRTGAAILGVSTDSVQSHEKFSRKYKFPFPLVADADKKIALAYGAWGEKKFMGVKYQGTHRMTFLIGPDGRIKKIWPRVKPAEHVAEVMAAL
jgi:peroxiredoxin Q/BCP